MLVSYTRVPDTLESPDGKQIPCTSHTIELKTVRRTTGLLRVCQAFCLGTTHAGPPALIWGWQLRLLLCMGELGLWGHGALLAAYFLVMCHTFRLCVELDPVLLGYSIDWLQSFNQLLCSQGQEEVLQLCP